MLGGDCYSELDLGENSRKSRNIVDLPVSCALVLSLAQETAEATLYDVEVYRAPTCIYNTILHPAPTSCWRSRTPPAPPLTPAAAPPPQPRRPPLRPSPSSSPSPSPSPSASRSPLWNRPTKFIIYPNFMDKCSDLSTFWITFIQNSSFLTHNSFVIHNISFLIFRF